MEEILWKPPRRKQLRIKKYDYSKEGMYFVTICTKNRKCILSEIYEKNECRLTIFFQFSIDKR